MTPTTTAPTAPTTYTAPTPYAAPPTYTGQKKDPRKPHAPEDIPRLSRLIAIAVMNSELRNRLHDKDRDWADDVVEGYKEEFDEKEAKEAEEAAKKKEAEDAAKAKKQADEAAAAAAAAKK